MSSVEKIKKLTRQLYPTGRAWRQPEEGSMDLLHQALAESEARAHDAATGLLDTILPDNDRFTETDAADWERRLGLITNTAVSLEDRKAAIKRKMNHPGSIPARQHYKYIEYALQLAGFDLYVYENRFDDYPSGYETRAPLVVSGGVGGVAIEHGERAHGEFEHGETYDPTKRVVNHIDEDIDELFYVTNLRNTFFIGASPVGTFASVDQERKTELRQLILKLKPVQTVAYLFINYV